MHLSKFKILLLLSAIIFTIRSWGQTGFNNTPSPSPVERTAIRQWRIERDSEMAVRPVGEADTICMSGPQYDFYARAVVERRQAQIDSTIQAGIIQNLYGSIREKRVQLTADSLIFKQKDEELGTATLAYLKCGAALSASIPKIKFWRRAFIVATLAVIIESVTIYTINRAK